MFFFAEYYDADITQPFFTDSAPCQLERRLVTVRVPALLYQGGPDQGRVAGLEPSAGHPGLNSMNLHFGRKVSGQIFTNLNSHFLP
jgi:hypothetical protein